MKHLIIQVSAETKEQAYEILNVLLAKKLTTGGQIIKSPARFLWKGEVTDLDYFTINSYTLNNLKEKIIEVVEKVSIEEVPMINFIAFEGNKKLTDWIEKTLS